MGAAARYAVVLWMEHKEQPYYVATFIVNSFGSLLMGVALHISIEQQLSTAFFATGFLGAFTTFSTLAFDTVKLLHEQDYRGVFLYPVLTLFAGIILCTLGYQL